MRAGDDAAARYARCVHCGRRWSPEHETCLLDRVRLTREGVHDEPTVLLSQSMVAAARASEPRDDTATATDVSTIDGARDVGGTTSMILSAGPVSSGEITAQTPRGVESVPPPSAQPASDPTTATRLDSVFVHLVPGTLVGEYVVERLLGSGGMGAVYGARHEKLGRRAAIKVIAPSLSVDADAVERFEQEALALARLSHPNIVGVLSVGTLPGDGRSYFLMEWLDGESLQARLIRGSCSPDDALDVLDQVARGLDAAHAAGIVHRDLKPDNVWLQRVGAEPRPVVKLLDFGLAKLAQHRRSEETAANVMFGTAAYMSPEQCRSARDVGPETDVYALGCVGYELLCGRLPFTYDNVAELVVAHQTEEPPCPRQLAPHLDPVLDSLLLVMIAKDPRRRPTVKQLRATLALAGSSARVEERRAAPPFVASTSRRPTRRSRAMLGAGVALLVVSVATLAARGRTEDHLVEHRVDDAQRDGDAKNPRAAAPIDAPTDAPVSIGVGVPAIDASAATPHVDAKRSVVTGRRESRTSPVDAAIAIDDDDTPSAPVSPDAGHPETTASSVAEEVRSEPALRRQAPPSQNETKKRTARDRRPNRDETFNPFARKRR